MSNPIPNYLVQVGDHLFAYWRLDVLMCDLALRKEAGAKVYKIKQGIITAYGPITNDELRDEYERAKKDEL